MADPDVRNPVAFLEALLALEWPGRAVCVTPAPFDPVEAPPLDDPRSFDVLDVVVGPHPDDTVFAHFRITLAAHLRRQDWIGAASIMLVTARQTFHEFQRAAEARKA